LQHKHGGVPGLTRKYDVNILVYFESFDRIEDAIAREKQLKGRNRAWKIRLIEKNNSGWNDLFGV
jgi:putative endonuclease